MLICDCERKDLRAVPDERVRYCGCTGKRVGMVTPVFFSKRIEKCIVVFTIRRAAGCASSGP
jgi:hypothetical protein